MANPEKWKQQLSSNKTWQLLEILIVFSPAIIAISGYFLLNIQNPMHFIASVWVANIGMLGLIGLGIKMRGETWATIGVAFARPQAKAVFWSILKALAILIFTVAAFIFGAILMLNLIGTPEGADMTQYNYMNGNLPYLILSLAGAYIVSSFGEEVVYRGFLMTRLQSIFGGDTKIAVAIALIISSFIFGLAHFGWGLTGIVQTAFMGAALATCFLLNKRNLWPLILAHGIMDTALFVQLYLAPAPALL
jgi:CAAX protease family protein